MTLKELYEATRGDADRLQDIVYEYVTMPAEYRATYSFEDFVEELEVCSICGEVNLPEHMTWHKWDIGNLEEKICESCRNDE